MAGSDDMEELVKSALRKFTISGNLPLIMSLRTRTRRVHTGVEGATLQSFLPTIKEVNERGKEESVSVCDGGGPMALQVVDTPEPITGDTCHWNRESGSRRRTRRNGKSG